MRAALVTALLLGGCSSILDFHECDTDYDCLGHAGADKVNLFCTTEHQCVDPAPCIISQQAKQDIDGDTVVIGGLYRLSGATANKSSQYRQASDLAAMQLNGIGQKVKHVACDTGGDVAQARALYIRLVQQFHAVGIVGPDTSDEILRGIAGVIGAYQVPIISPAATSPTITNLTDGDLVWRTAPSDLQQSVVLAQIVPDDATSPLDIVYVDDSAYASGLVDSFLDSWRGTLEQTLVFKTEQVAATVKQMNMPASALLIADVDAPALVQAIQGSASLGKTNFYMSEGAVSDALWGPGPTWDFGFLGRFRGTSPGLRPDAGSLNAFNTFRQQYAPRFGQEPDATAYVTNTYDAFFCMALAALASPAPHSGSDVVANLKRLSDKASSTKVDVGALGFSTALPVLMAGRTVDLTGTSGPIDFNDKGDVVTAPISVWHIESKSNGQPYFNVIEVRTP
jgi:branched-chain amino acid transport system substrate-binding protein